MKLGIDVFGNIAILKFERNVKQSQKKRVAEKFLKDHKQVRTILEKVEKFSGRLRTHKTKHIAGEKTKEALYRENGCVFRFNVDTCYFSGRLSEERKEIAEMVKGNEDVLVMFGGAGPFVIVIAKNSRAGRVVSVELGRECTKYAKINVKRNKLEGKVEIIGGDVRKVLPKMKGKFDRIVMSRPNLSDSFLDVAFPLVKKGGVIHYYGFSGKLQENVRDGKINSKKPDVKLSRNSSYDNNRLVKKDIQELRELIVSEAKKARKKIKILRVKKAGDIGPYRFRYRVDLKVA